jgi:hypothetical protein
MNSNQSTQVQWHFNGTTDAITTCQKCGKMNLKKTVALKGATDANQHETVYYGSVCAARALRFRNTARAHVDRMFGYMDRDRDDRDRTIAQVTSAIRDRGVSPRAFWRNKGYFIEPGVLIIKFSVLQPEARIAFLPLMREFQRMQDKRAAIEQNNAVEYGAEWNANL